MIGFMIFYAVSRILVRKCCSKNVFYAEAVNSAKILKHFYLKVQINFCCTRLQTTIARDRRSNGAKIKQNEAEMSKIRSVV